jgi:hypothetical protein
MYNATGDKIQTLVDGNQDSGTHTLNFNMKDVNVKPGLYLIRIIGDDKTTTLRLVFVE